MKPIAIILAAVLALFTLPAADAAASDILVVEDAPHSRVTITNIRTGESRMVRADENGRAQFNGLHPGVYRLESENTVPQYKEITDADVATWQVQLDAGDPVDVGAELDKLPPDIRQDVKRALDGADKPYDKGRALEGQIRKVERRLARALTANEETPGLFNIRALIDALQAMQRLRIHYYKEGSSGGSSSQDSRTSAAEGPLTIEPWQTWQSPFSSYIGAVAGAEFVDMPRVGIGTLIAGGEERALLRSDGSVVAATGGLRVGYQFGSFGPLGDARLVAAYSYLSGDASASASEPAGGNTVAITYHTPAPNGSTGLGLGATGLSASEEVDVSAHRLTLGVAGNIPLDADSRVSLSPFIGFKYEHLEQDYSGRLQNLTFADITSTTEQSVDETLVGPSVGAYLTLHPVQNVTLRLGGKVDLLYRSADLDSVQSNRCGLCAAPEDAFDAHISDEDDDWTYRLNLSTGFYYIPNGWFALGVEGGVRYLDERSAIRNPANPAEPATHLGTESATDGYGVMEFQFRF